MNYGHVHLFRKIWNNPVLQEKNKIFSRLEAWIWIVSREARGKDDPKSGLKRGEFRVSIRQLAKAWNWNRSRVHRFLQDLQKGPDPMIKKVRQQMRHLLEHFIVCKYETYNKTWDSKRDSKRDILNKDKKKEKIKDSTVPLEPDRLLAIYADENKRLPAVLEFTESRKNKCRIRIEAAIKKGRPDEYLEEFRSGIRKAQKTPFLRGEGENGWKATFDWFVANDRNLYKVLEGNYDGECRKKENKNGSEVGKPSEPAEYPENWSEERWELFEKVNGPEAAKKLHKEIENGKL